MGDLTGNQDKAIASLLEHRTIGEAAAAIWVTESTIFRWLQEPDFQEAYREARRQAVQKAISYLQQSCSEAVEVLRQIMLSKTNPASSRVMAARIILDTTVKTAEVDNLVSRVEKLEKLLKAKKQGW